MAMEHNHRLVACLARNGLNRMENRGLFALDAKRAIAARIVQHFGAPQLTGGSTTGLSVTDACRQSLGR
jgi:hypothetical protein